LHLESRTGVFSLEDLKELGRKEGVCPYYAARHMASYAGLIICSYQYAIDPRIAEHVTAEFGPDTICVFDEAHNIGPCCRRALSD
jgi:DNA excision repair protein ERCC-2